MSWTTLSKPAVGDPTTKEFADAVVDNFAYLKSAADSQTASGGSAVVLNGSFEVDTDADLTPDSWSLTVYNSGAGGSGAIDTTASSHGGKSFKFVTPGTQGGGEIINSDYITCTPKRTYTISFQVKVSATGISNKVKLLYYDSALTYISEDTLYSSTTDTTSFLLKSGSKTPPSTARFMKIKLIGGDTGVATAGSSWFDDVAMKIAESSASMAIELHTSSTTWTCPDNVFTVKVRAWGGGGAGHNTASSGYGGGGGEYVEKVISVVPGTGYAIVVGAGGTSAGAGSNTTFNSTDVVAVGGGGGTGSSGGAGGTGGTGTLKISGEKGGNNYGGSASNGGGRAQAIGTTGTAGNAPGGGGSNGSSSAAGAAGWVVLEY